MAEGAESLPSEGEAVVAELEEQRSLLGTRCVALARVAAVLRGENARLRALLVAHGVDVGAAPSATQEHDDQQPGIQE